MRRLLFAMSVSVIVAALPAVTLGHAELLSTEPADGALLDAPPTEVVITFDGELQPAGSVFRASGPSGEIGTGTVDLQVAERNVLRGAVSISEPGIYTVKWTVVAEDGDAQAGDFSFTVGGGEIPETALPAVAPVEPMRLAVTLAGLALLVGAGAAHLARRQPSAR
jgi:methionine-rich copper-binding protein CopC